MDANLTKQTTQYLLVPDSSAARRTRRALAEKGACKGIVVGTWPELVEYARNAYLIPVPGNDWDEGFNTNLAGMGAAFWSESYAVSPQETANAVEAVWCGLVSASDPGGYLQIPLPDQLPERLRKHLEDLIQLAGTLDGQLPA